MPWESRTVKQQREHFIQAALETPNFSALCREYGISRKTGYKWLKRYRSGDGVGDRSRKPGTTPNKTPPAVEEQILIHIECSP